ncbi:hypothetical protein ABFS83_10G143300 [Erythranthe nasuta]
MDHKISPSPKMAAELIAENDDLLTGLILLRLPEKSLMRFKSVSKRWQSLISSPHFAAAHTNHHHHRRRRRGRILPSFILGTAAQPPEFFYFNPNTGVFLPYTFEHPHTKILQSSHGLLLLECRNPRLGFPRVHYRVYNPTTRKSRKVEFDEYEGRLAWIWGLSLSFDPSISPYYKLICTRRPNFYSTLWIEIYHSETDTWQHITGVEINYTPIHDLQYWAGISCNDGLYWIRPGSKSYRFDVQTRHLEEMSAIKFPWGEPDSSSGNNNYIVESDGNAHCVCTYFGYKNKYLIVYELSPDRDTGWVEKYWADLNPVSEATGLCLRLVGIIMRGDKEVDSSVLLHAPGMIIRYWFWVKRFEVLCNFTSSTIYKKDEFQFKTKFCYQFIESLAPV